MKGTETFKNTIKAHLDNRAAQDPLFAVRYQQEGKSIDECVNYILNTVKKSGCHGFADEEIYSMAAHYYDESDISEKDLKEVGCNVVVNHHIELTEEEKAKLKEKAEKDYYNQQLDKARNAEKRRAEAKRKEAEEKAAKFKVVQTSLF